MEEQIITIFCLCDDYIQSINHVDWPNTKLSTSEVLLISFISTRFFYGNIENSRKFLIEHGYIKNLSKSALNRRMHQIPYDWWNNILGFIQKWKGSCEATIEYIVDAFPISVCRNIRIQNCRILQGEAIRGYNVSKKEYFYGMKATVITTRSGCPVQALLCPGGEHDSVPFKHMELTLPIGSELYGDSAYLDYEHEERLLKEKQVRLIAARKSNSRKPLALEDFVNLTHIRGQIESTFGLISRLLPRKIHSITPEGFEIKVLAFIVAAATFFI